MAGEFGDAGHAGGGGRQSLARLRQGAIGPGDDGRTGAGALDPRRTRFGEDGRLARSQPHLPARRGQQRLALQHRDARRPGSRHLEQIAAGLQHRHTGLRGDDLRRLPRCQAGQHHIGGAVRQRRGQPGVVQRRELQVRAALQGDAALADLDQCAAAGGGIDGMALDHRQVAAGRLPLFPTRHAIGHLAADARDPADLGRRIHRLGHRHRGAGGGRRGLCRQRGRRQQQKQRKRENGGARARLRDAVHGVILPGRARRHGGSTRGIAGSSRRCRGDAAAGRP